MMHGTTNIKIRRTKLNKSWY